MLAHLAVCILLLLSFRWQPAIGRSFTFNDMDAKRELPAWYSPPATGRAAANLSNIGVYMRTYPRDALIAAYAIVSVLQNIPAVAEVVVVTPAVEIPAVAAPFRRVLGLINVTFHASESSCEPTGARVRVVPVGCGVYALPGGWYWKWASRQQLFFDAIHADLYVTKPFVLYIESDVFVVRRVAPRHLFQDGRPVIEYLTLSFLCRYLIDHIQDFTLVMKICQKHETTARDAGTLLGVFNHYDTERRIPMIFARAMFPSMRRRIRTIHSCVSCVMDYFSRHTKDCTENWNYNPFIWLPVYTQDHLRRKRISTQSKICLIGLSKPHTLGTFAVHFSRKLHYVRNLEKEAPAEYIALQLFSHNLFENETKLKPHVANFLQCAFIRPQTGYIDLDPAKVRATPSLVGLRPDEVA